MHPQKIILVSGFSGAGKTTFWQELLSQYPEQLVKVISTTTREPREGEKHGKDYYFLQPDEFHTKRELGHFLETSEHYGNHYGSPIPEQLNLLPEQIPLYTVDTNGVAYIKQHHPHAQAFFLYISPEEQYRRLTSRNDATPEIIQKRLDRYQEEAKALESNSHLYHILRNEEPGDMKKAIELFRQTAQLG